MNSVGTAFSIVSSIGGAIAVLWVVATVVRRQRPDAYRPLLAWAVASLVMILVNIVAYPLVGFFVRGSIDDYLAATGVLRIVSASIGVGLVVLLVRGLVAIAQPPKPLEVKSDVPYR